MELLTIIAPLLIVIIFWGLFTRIAKQGEAVVDNAFGALALSSQVLPLKAEQFVAEAEFDLEEKQLSLKTRREAFTTKNPVEL